MNYSEDHLKRILSDVEYLIDEAEALTSVIDAVPVGEKAAGVESMLDMMALIDHAQLQYYRPLIESLYSVPDFESAPKDFRSSYKDELNRQQVSPDTTPDKERVRSLLKSIAGNRRELLQFVNKLPLDDLRQTGKINGENKSIADLLEDMVVFERSQLKAVAERVLALDNNMKPGREQ